MPASLHASLDRIGLRAPQTVFHSTEFALEFAEEFLSGDSQIMTRESYAQLLEEVALYGPKGAVIFYGCLS